MSLLQDYEERTAWKYEPIRGSFHTHEGLLHKVNPDGSYAPFQGSTVVFKAGEQCVQAIQTIQRILCHKLDGTGMLASPLPDPTVHMTLHDLISPEACTSTLPEEFSHEVADSIAMAAEIVRKIRKEYAGRKISMVPDRIVNMVSKSLVLMLRPQTDADFELLLELYHRFDDVKKLSYPLTPHITLAYFRPGMIDGDTLGAAVGPAQPDPEKSPVFEFSPEGLTAQKFLDMQTYTDIP